MYSTWFRVAWALLVGIAASVLVSFGHRWAWFVLVIPAFMVFGYYRYGEVTLAFAAYVENDWARVNKHLARTAFPNLLTAESTAYYYFLSGGAELQRGNLTGAATLLESVNPLHLRTDNIRCVWQCNLAAVALDQGKLEAARQHLNEARSIPHNDQTDLLIKQLDGLIAAV